MKRFMLLYAGPAPKLSELPSEQATAVVDSWKQWAAGLGDAIVDAGMPFIDGAELIDNGEQETALPLNGYAVVKAEDLVGAVALTQNHPFLSGNERTFSINIFELMTEPLSSYAQAQAAAAPANEPLTAAPVAPAQNPPQPAVPPPAQPQPTAAPQNPGELVVPHEAAPEEQPLNPPAPPTA